MARLYYRHVPGLTGSAEEMLNGMPKGITRQQFMGMLMAHYDLRLAETATFKPAEVAALANRHEELVTSLCGRCLSRPAPWLRCSRSSCFSATQSGSAQRSILATRSLFPCRMQPSAMSTGLWTG